MSKDHLTDRVQTFFKWLQIHSPHSLADIPEFDERFLALTHGEIGALLRLINQEAGFDPGIAAQIGEFVAQFTDEELSQTPPEMGVGPGLLRRGRVLVVQHKFKMGTLVATPGVRALIDKGLDWQVYLARHVCGDWGDLVEADKKENEFSLENGYRLFSAYETPQGRIYIITEADRSVTTILLPDEY